MRGRKPLATSVKKFTGAATKNPQRINKNEPTPPPGAPTKPEHLDETASAKWDQLVELFGEMKMLNRADGDLMEQYCVTYSGYRQALASVRRTGLVLVSEDLKVKRNPFSGELHKYMDRLAKLMAEMGLTPSSRTRVSAASTAEEDPLADIMRRRIGVG